MNIAAKNLETEINTYFRWIENYPKSKIIRYQKESLIAILNRILFPQDDLITIDEVDRLKLRFVREDERHYNEYIGISFVKMNKNIYSLLKWMNDYSNFSIPPELKPRVNNLFKKINEMEIGTAAEIAEYNKIERF